MKKHELIPSDKQGLFRVKALIDFGDVKAGNVGGYVASERNLSQAGSCWVYGNARVYDNARVSGNAQVYGNARVLGDARVLGNAQVYGNARVLGNAQVYDNARVSGNAQVYDNAQVFGDAKVTKSVITITSVLPHHVTISDTHIAIGCENHTIEHWKKNINKIGKKNKYKLNQIKYTKILLQTALKARKALK